MSYILAPDNIYGYTFSAILTMICSIALTRLGVLKEPFDAEFSFYVFSGLFWPVFWLCLFLRVFYRSLMTFISVMFND